MDGSGIFPEEAFFISNETAWEVTYTGVLLGVLFWRLGLGVTLLADWGVLHFDMLTGVFFGKAPRKSLFVPICLDILLQVWQVAN